MNIEISKTKNRTVLIVRDRLGTLRGVCYLPQECVLSNKDKEEIAKKVMLWCRQNWANYRYEAIIY